MNIIWFALNYEFQFSCNGSYVNQERETSITNEDLIIFSVLNREKILWFCLEFQMEHSLKDRKTNITLKQTS